MSNLFNCLQMTDKVSDYITLSDYNHFIVVMQIRIRFALKVGIPKTILFVDCATFDVLMLPSPLYRMYVNVCNSCASYLVFLYMLFFVWKPLKALLASLASLKDVPYGHDLLCVQGCPFCMWDQPWWAWPMAPTGASLLPFLQKCLVFITLQPSTKLTRKAWTLTLLPVF